MSILDVIKYEGDNQTLVYKYPRQDFTTYSQLVVRESQNALLMLRGQAMDLFLPGTYTLHTDNIPLLNKLINLPFGGESPFHCEVYYINMAEHMSIPWGVGNIIFRDKNNGNYPFRIGANGEMSLVVTDPRRLIERLVGTEAVLDNNTISNYFRAAITQEIKNLLPQIFQRKEYSVFDIETELSETSEDLKVQVNRWFSEYGLSVVQFWINSLAMPEEDPAYRDLLRLHGKNVTLDLEGDIRKRQALIDSDVKAAQHIGDVRVKQMDAEAEKYRRKLEAEADQYHRKLDIDAEAYSQQRLGYTWKEGKQAQVMQGLAENEGSGSDIRNGLMGVGVGLGVGGAVGGMFQDAANEFFHSAADRQTEENAEDLWDDGFPDNVELKTDFPASFGETSEEEEKNASDTGKETVKLSMDEFKEKVAKLAFMKDSGLLTEEEFEERKSRLLSMI